MRAHGAKHKASSHAQASQFLVAIGEESHARLEYQALFNTVALMQIDDIVQRLKLP